MNPRAVRAGSAAGLWEGTASIRHGRLQIIDIARLIVRVHFNEGPGYEFD
jgi:hypothetical protein